MVGWEILHPIQVSSKEKESLPEFSASLQVPLCPLASASTTLALGHC
jgi:hypothetical protein